MSDQIGGQVVGVFVSLAGLAVLTVAVVSGAILGVAGELMRPDLNEVDLDDDEGVGG